MKARAALMAAMCAVALLSFGWLVRELSFVSVGLAANDDVQRALRRGLDDQKQLARWDASHAAAYRRRFDDTRRLLGRIEILALSRHDLARRVELVLLATVASILALGTALVLFEQRSRERRLVRLGVALGALSRGETDIVAGERRRDLIGRIGRMIEETSRVMARHRRRVQSLEHLAAWQEAARRHAHEIRTPLAATQMELARLVKLIERRAPEAKEELRQAEASILEELDVLRQFTSNFASFAAVGQPQLRCQDVGQLVDEFVAMFAPTWPNLAFAVTPADGECTAMLDRDMIRRVLVNLCSNSALAGGDGRVNIVLATRRVSSNVIVDVADDGPGIDPSIRGRLFEPYVTTRRIGEGMGLGLAISRKILLDHGGDLESLAIATGATFRLTLPAGEGN
jgi:two-component system nitrogen regulation sensor histidine kinase NtrY